MHYPAQVSTMPVPCSSGLKPGWILHAFEQGLDGVFIGSDGDECALLDDCGARTGRVIAQAQELMKARGIAPQRLKMAAICSVCAEPFVGYMREFSQALTKLGPISTATAPAAVAS